MRGRGAGGAWGGGGAVRVSRGGATLLLSLLVHAHSLVGLGSEDAAAMSNSTSAPPSRCPEVYLSRCRAPERDCAALDHPCISCNRSTDCRYGLPVDYSCTVRTKVHCKGPRTFNRTAACRFCYQTEKWEHRCVEKASCNSVASPLKYYIANCTVLEGVQCLGRREFPQRLRCAWAGGARWGAALALALALGGFGADRFYLGHWQEGIGKLFSFGGLGVWTLVDALLIGVHHLGPADGSLYL